VVSPYEGADLARRADRATVGPLRALRSEGSEGSKVAPWHRPLAVIPEGQARDPAHPRSNTREHLEPPSAPSARPARLATESSGYIRNYALQASEGRRHYRP
jgi:hypothetical protein